jgi:hypothetical protein
LVVLVVAVGIAVVRARQHRQWYDRREVKRKKPSQERDGDQRW